MEFTIDLALGGWVLAIAAALIFGAIVQFIGDVRLGYEWIVAAVAFFLGAVIASEFITAWRTFEPVWEGLALVPALAGGLVLGIAADVVTRLSTGGHYTTTAA
ncbi:MAG TPA: hypothetical protein VFT20_01585 [Candidatus Limnocylindrales bacterium]|nr:hypothetical protein [Candidatus Limnocylindrales bacterium]